MNRFLAGVLLSSVLLTACGGSDGGTGQPQPVDNQAPVVHSFTTSGDPVVSQSYSITAEATDKDGSISSYSWRLDSSQQIELKGSDSATVSFVIPASAAGEAIQLTVTVTDDDGAQHSSQVTVPVPEIDQDGITVDKAFASLVEVSYVSMDEVNRVSRFRSSVGHSYTDGFETCRSMKHYFDLSVPNAQIFSPVEGEVQEVIAEQSGLGVQVEIFHFIDERHVAVFKLFHLDGNSLMVKAGDKVKANELLGQHIGAQTYSDIAVELISAKGDVATPNPDNPAHWEIRLESWFALMTETLREDMRVNYGIGDDVYISARQRDAAPLTCNGEAFDSSSETLGGQWITLTHR